MSETLHKWVNTIIALAVVVLLFLIFSKKENSGETVSVKIDSSMFHVKLDSSLWHPSLIIQGGKPSEINIQGLDMAGLRALLDSLIPLYLSLSQTHNEIVQYDSTWKDSSYSERIKFQVQKNRLLTFERNLNVYSKTITITKPQSFAIFGGSYINQTPDRTTYGLGLSAVLKSDFLISGGKNLNSSGWYASVMYKLK